MSDLKKPPKSQMDVLEAVFSREIEAAMNGGIGLYQTGKKAARILCDQGLLSESTILLPGRLPVAVTGYELTHLGRMTYGKFCEPDEESEHTPK